MTIDSEISSNQPSAKPKHDKFFVSCLVYKIGNVELLRERIHNEESVIINLEYQRIKKIIRQKVFQMKDLDIKRRRYSSS